MDQVEQVRVKSDIVEVVGSRVTVKKAGRNFKGLCPFHGEKSPSFMVSPERQTFKCFGCGEGGDVFTFLQKYDGMSFLESLEFLAGKAGVKLESYRPSSQDLQRKRLLEIAHLASEYFTWILHNHKSAEVARKYLKDRKIISDSVKRFGLGYAPEQWRSVSDFLVNKKGYSVDELESVGLVIRNQKGHYDRFRGRLIFPLKDHKGAVVGFSGRVMPGGDEKSAKYINSPETKIYSKSKMLYGLWENREFIRKDDRIVLTEGELDMIPSYQARVKSVVAIKGSAFTEDQAQLINRYTKNIVMALDADQAGEAAIKRAVKIAESMDMSIRVVQIKEEKDPGDVATKDGKVWRELVKGAVAYYDFLIDSVIAKYGTESGESARIITAEVIPTIAEIENLVVKAHYVKLFAKRLGVPEDSVYEEVERVEKKKELKSLKKVVKKIEEKSESRREKLEEYGLSLMLQYYSDFKDELSSIEVEWFSLTSISKIVEQLMKWKPKTLDIAKFAKGVPIELHEMIDKAYLRDMSALGRDVERVKKEFNKTSNEIEEMYFKEEIRKVSGKIAEAEVEGGSGLKTLQKEFSKLSRKLSSIG